MFNLLRNHQTVFHTGYTVLHFHQQCLRLPIFSHPHPHLFCCFDHSHLSGWAVVSHCVCSLKKKVLIWLSHGTRDLSVWHTDSLVVVLRLRSYGARTSLLHRVSDPSSPTRDLTYVPCIARWILNHWTTREVPHCGFDLHFSND